MPWAIPAGRRGLNLLVLSVGTLNMELEVSMSTPTPLPEPWTLDLTKERGPAQEFTTLEELEAWWTKQRQFLERSSSLSDKDPARTIMNQIATRLSAAREANSGSKESFPHRLQKALQEIERVFTSGRLPHSQTARGKKLQEISSRCGTGPAGQALGLWAQQPNATQYGNQTPLFEAMCFDRGISGSADAEREALADLHRELQEAQRQVLADCQERQAAISSAQADGEKLKDRLSSTLDSAQKASSKQTEDYKSAVTKAQETLDEQIETAKGKVTEFVDYYEKKIQLHSSVTYWTKLRGANRIQAGVVLAVITIVGIALGTYLNAWIDWLLRLQGEPRLQVLILAGLGAGAIAWGLRILVRLFLSAVHLQADADERVTMLQTYLALMKNGEGIQDDDRALMIQTVFRPASSGIVKEDGIPATMWDLMGRALAGKAGRV